jgi:hypothetical protein
MFNSKEKKIVVLKQEKLLVFKSFIVSLIFEMSLFIIWDKEGEKYQYQP